eukprot:3937914-Rhodomonas_salina.2
MRSSVVISPRSCWSRSSISWVKRAIAGSSSGKARGDGAGKGRVLLLELSAQQPAGALANWPGWPPAALLLLFAGQALNMWPGWWHV